VKTTILINLGGGSVGERSAIEAALESAGIAGELHWLHGREIREAAKAAVAGGDGLVIAGGGDGTVSSVAGALAGTRTKLAILPLGTLNHFARDLRIPQKLMLQGGNFNSCRLPFLRRHFCWVVMAGNQAG